MDRWGSWKEKGKSGGEALFSLVLADGGRDVTGGAPSGAELEAGRSDVELNVSIGDFGDSDGERHLQARRLRGKRGVAYQKKKKEGG